MHKTRDEILASINSHQDEALRLEKIMEESKLCRCRQRIPAPVLVVRGRTIARSAALSESLEYAYQTGDLTSLSGFGKDKMRANRTHLDTTWLRVLKVKYICDLMVEDIRKMCVPTRSNEANIPSHDFSLFRMTLRLSTSENASAEYRNAGFGVCKLPYPGVESFRNYTEHVRSISFPKPNWKKLDSELRLAVPFNLPDPYDWKHYQTWDLIELTQNYIRYMLHLIRSDPDPHGGILIHCISGWDRTPMFVTLLRILFWAEGEAHQSLNVDQMLYLCVAYDWALFGHQLGHRLSKRYEIIYFCFYVLQHLLSDEFSLGLGPHCEEVIALTTQSSSSSSSSTSELPSSAESTRTNSERSDLSTPKKRRLIDSDGVVLLDENEHTSSSSSSSASGSSTPPRTPSIGLASPKSPRVRPPTTETELVERQALRKARLFDLSEKFMALYNKYTEPIYKR